MCFFRTESLRDQAGHKLPFTKNDFNNYFYQWPLSVPSCGLHIIWVWKNGLFLTTQENSKHKQTEIESTCISTTSGIDLEGSTG